MTEAEAETREWSIRLTWTNVGIAIALVVASFTTIVGMHELTRSLLAIPVALLVQFVIFQTSRRLGAIIARAASHRQDDSQLSAGSARLQHRLLTGIYLAALIVSFFCAFNFYYHRFSELSEDQLVAESQPETYASEILPALRKLVEDKRKELVRQFAGDPAVKAYSDEMTKLAEFAGQPAVKDKIREAAKARAQTQYDEEKNRRDKLESRIKELSSELSNLEASYRPPTSASGSTAAQVKDLEQRISDFEKAMDAESQIGTTLGPDGPAAKLVNDPACRNKRPGGPGAGREGNQPGTCYYALKTAREKAVNALSQLREMTRTNAAEAKSKEQKKIELRQTIDKLKDDLARTPPPRDPKLATDASGDKDLTQTLRDSTQALFDDPTPEKLEQAAKICITLKSALTDSPSANCRPEAVRSATLPYADYKAGVAAFLNKCGVEPAAAKIKEILESIRKTDDAKADQGSESRGARLAKGLENTQTDLVRPCLDSVTDPRIGVDSTSLTRRSVSFVQAHSPRRDEFSLTARALVDLVKGAGTAASVMGAFIALVQEVLILLLSFLDDLNKNSELDGGSGSRSLHGENLRLHEVDWSPNAEDPPHVAAAKAILRSLVDRGDGAAEFPDDIDAESDISETEAINAKKLILQLGREKLITRGLFGGARRLSPEGVLRLERIVNDHFMAQAEPAPTPVPTPPAPPPAMPPASAGAAAPFKPAPFAPTAPPPAPAPEAAPRPAQPVPAAVPRTPSTESPQPTLRERRRAELLNQGNRDGDRYA